MTKALNKNCVNAKIQKIALSITVLIRNWKKLVLKLMTSISNETKASLMNMGLLKLKHQFYVVTKKVK